MGRLGNRIKSWGYAVEIFVIIARVAALTEPFVAVWWKKNSTSVVCVSNSDVKPIYYYSTSAVSVPS